MSPAGPGDVPSLSSREPLPVAVVGCGRMGRLHARVFSEMSRVKLVGVFDSDADKAATVADEFDCRTLSSLDEVAQRAAAVTVAVPTMHHLSVAEPLLLNRVACLIEKPLAPNVEEGQKIVDLARQHSAVVQVGHIERFNPALRAVARLNIRPRFMEVTRISPLTFRSIDVGVVLDMMIHDLDIVLRLAGAKIDRIDAVGVSVIGDVEDICNARLTFENGVVANVTASRLAMRTERRMRLFSSDAYVSLDFQKRYGIVARRSGNLEAIRNTVAKIRSGEIQDLSEVNYADLVNIEELQTDDVEPLRAELEAFIDAATGKAPPAVTVEEGLAAVDLATRIVASIQPNAL